MTNDILTELKSVSTNTLIDDIHKRVIDNYYVANKCQYINELVFYSLYIDILEFIGSNLSRRLQKFDGQKCIDNIRVRTAAKRLQLFRDYQADMFPAKIAALERKGALDFMEKNRLQLYRQYGKLEVSRLNDLKHDLWLN